MNYLSVAKAQSIINLAAANLAADAQRNEFADTLEQIFAPLCSEERALNDALETLSHDEAVDLVALMYVGRSDLYDELIDRSQARLAFSVYRHSFAHDETSALISLFYEKDLNLVKYLSAGLQLIEEANTRALLKELIPGFSLSKQESEY